MQTFSISIPKADYEDLQKRLARFRPPPEPADAGWQYGINLDYLSKTLAYWRNDFDWAAQEEALNKFPHAMVEVAPNSGESLKLHVIHKSCGVAGAQTVLLLAGWPSSFLEFRHVVDQLTQPSDGKPPVDVVVIDLPGFGLSDAPKVPMAHREMAAYVRAAMVEELKVDRFVIAGGDWGAVVGSWLAFDYAECVEGIYLTMMGLRPGLDRATEFSSAESAWMKKVKKHSMLDGGYREAQATKPTTLNVGLSDSPAATLAWIAEKYHGWTTMGQNAATPPMSADDILTAATLFWWKNRLPTANWIYWADRNLGNFGLQPGERIETPTGFSFFGQGFFPPVPAEWTERAHNVVFRQDHPTGGHFPAWVNPTMFVKSLSDFLAVLR